MLAGACLSNDTGLSHLLCQEHLPQDVVYLVGTRVIEILSLEKYLCPAQVLCHFSRIIQKRRTSRIAVQKPGQLLRKCGIFFIIFICLLQADQLVHQRLGNILPAKISESSFSHLPALPGLSSLTKNYLSVILCLCCLYIKTIYQFCSALSFIYSSINVFMFSGIFSGPARLSRLLHAGRRKKGFHFFRVLASVGLHFAADIHGSGMKASDCRSDIFCRKASCQKP